LKTNLYWQFLDFLGSHKCAIYATTVEKSSSCIVAANWGGASKKQEVKGNSAERETSSKGEAQKLRARRQ
jgi:hypothetical protein